MVYGVATAAGLLLAGNLAVELLERLGALQTHRPDDGVAQVDEELFQRAGQRYRTASWASRLVPEQSFALPRPEGTWRLFVLGGSFAKGTPYVTGDHARPGSEGGMGSWVQAALAARHPDLEIEVINAAIGGASSGAVRDMAQQVLELQPDALLVASCNNEGSLAPGRIRRLLQQQGGYRLLQRLLAPEPERPLYAPQDAEDRALREQFVAHMRALLAAAEARQVPVLLATLPVRLRYKGLEPGHVAAGRGWPLLEGVCWQALRRFEREEYALAAPLLEACARRPAEQQPPPLALYRVLAALEQGQAPARARPVLAEGYGSCVAEGILEYYRGAFEAAQEQLRTCDEVAEALLWTGLARAAAGRPAQARSLLEQAVELVPRNRCRPSFNGQLRQLASEHAGAHLVDLEAAAQASSPGGLPGAELFDDYCHLQWWGYAQMAEEVLRVLEASQLLPTGEAGAGPAPSREELRQLWGLPLDGYAEGLPG